MSDRFFLLMSRHQRLDDELRDELRRPLPDVMKLQRLKRLKLRVKDRLARMMGRGRVLRPSM